MVLLQKSFLVSLCLPPTSQYTHTSENGPSSLVQEDSTTSFQGCHKDKCDKYQSRTFLHSLGKYVISIYYVRPLLGAEDTVMSKIQTVSSWGLRPGHIRFRG